jgi:hypothetical protein
VIGAVLLSAVVAQVGSTAQPEPYNLGAPATVEGSKRTVTKLLEATRNKDDAAYDKIGRGMVVMLAADFGAPVDRTKFEQSLAGCTDIKVVSSRPFPNMPQAQAVRVFMKCAEKGRVQPIQASADIMANDEHTFMVLPRGVESVWPEKGRR